MGGRNAQAERRKERLERVVQELDRRVERFGDATLQAYERRRQRLIDDVAGDLPEAPEPQWPAVEERP